MFLRTNTGNSQKIYFSCRQIREYVQTYACFYDFIEMATAQAYTWYTCMYVVMYVVMYVIMYVHNSCSRRKNTGVSFGEYLFDHLPLGGKSPVKLSEPEEASIIK